MTEARERTTINCRLLIRSSSFSILSEHSARKNGDTVDGNELCALVNLHRVSFARRGSKVSSCRQKRTQSERPRVILDLITRPLITPIISGHRHRVISSTVSSLAARDGTSRNDVESSSSPFSLSLPIPPCWIHDRDLANRFSVSPPDSSRSPGINSDDGKVSG